MNGDWLRAHRTEAGAERILDAAGELFVTHGVAGTGMEAVATAAGCSRATLYRYFENRQALHIAFAHREARRIVQRVPAEVAGVRDPAERVVAATMAVIRDVRATPALAVWFGRNETGIVTELVQSSQVIEALAAAFLADGSQGNPEVTRRARWLVRVIVSFLTWPGADPADERALLEQFVVPLLTAPGQRA